MDKKNAINLLDETFNHDFNNENFYKIIKELFNKFQISKRDCTRYIPKEYLEYINSFEKIGDYEDSSGKEIEVLIVKLNKTSSRDRARTMQRNFISNWLGKIEKDAALVAFYGDDPQDWRFSFVKMEYNLVKDEKGKTKISKELTPAKRYSFLVGINEPNHTCASQFVDLMIQEEKNPSLEEIEHAFSIEKVTKEFFDKYKKLFLDLKESLEKVIKKDRLVKEEFEEKAIDPVDFTKKLLGQIVFLYFLQKKGWLGVEKGEDGKLKPWGTGPKDFMKRLFNGKISPYKNFYNEILEPLFYEALATERYDDYYTHFKCKIPFLNGGLFEPINDYNWRETDILLDNKIFEDIFRTFDEFNFTVKEDEPLEKEVAVDPEMLGKVFENLLEVKDRKSKGAFYTPREIVHYMCQQSLINYLETNTSISRKDLEKFIQLGDFALDVIIKEQEQIKKYGRSYVEDKFTIPKSIRENHKEIDRLLKEIKVVDPAVGSGAFPVGMMNEIVKARSILSIYFKENRKDYDLKREIIENCLYGVDIESSAVEITKLRFWLSLIVDELDMKNIKPLPNLDHKIMCGNSLLEEFEGIKLFDEKLLGDVEKDNSLEIKQIDDEIDELYKEKGKIITGKSNGDVKKLEKEIKSLERKKKKLISGPKTIERNQTLDEATENRIKESQKKLNKYKSLQKEFFNEQNKKKKKQLKEDMDRIEWELIEETLKEQGNEKAIEKLDQYKKNKAKPFFLWKLYFAEIFQRENPGFDVVIANPPYVKEYTNKHAFDGLRNSPYYQGKLDLWYLFACEGVDLLRDGGVECFIAPNNWISNAGASLFREKVVRDVQILQFIDFGNFKIFTAGIQTMVYLFKKSKINSKYNLMYSKLLNDHIDSKELYNFLYSKSENSYFLKYDVEFNRDEFKNDYITFLRKELTGFLNKIQNQGNFYLTKQEIAQGIVSPQENLNKGNAEKLKNLFPVGKGIFVLNNKEKESLNLTEKELELIKPYYTTKEISRYKFSPKNKSWIIYTKSDIKKRINKYPNIKNHLDNFKKIITSDNKPYGLHRAREEKFFKGDKIISLRKCSKPSFTYVGKDSYVSQTFFLIKTDRIEMKYLLSVLNSKLISFWLYYKGKLQGNLYQIDYVPLSKIPIKQIPKEQQKPFIKLVDQVLEITKSNDYLDNPDKHAKVKKLEKEIDQLVYKLYELTPKEIKIVEEFNEE